MGTQSIHTKFWKNSISGTQKSPGAMQSLGEMNSPFGFFSEKKNPNFEFVFFFFRKNSKFIGEKKPRKEFGFFFRMDVPIVQNRNEVAPIFVNNCVFLHLFWQQEWLLFMLLASSLRALGSSWSRTVEEEGGKWDGRKKKLVAKWCLWPVGFLRGILNKLSTMYY